MDRLDAYEFSPHVVVPNKDARSCMIPPGHPPSSRSLARADRAADEFPRRRLSGRTKPLTYGVRKQPHVRFPLSGNVSAVQRRTIRKLAEALEVDPAELICE